MPIYVRAGTEVAVMPFGAKSPLDVIRIDTVDSAGIAIIKLSDGSVYYAADGHSVTMSCYIVPASEEHRTAVQSRSK